MIITRKIEIYINEENKEARKQYYDTLFGWLRIRHKAANLASTHLYCQDNIKEFIYLTEDVKVKLADTSKDDAGILNTSYQNSIYRLLSSNFLKQIPSDILSNLSQAIYKTYSKEKSDVYKGKISLRSYRENIPIPFGSKWVTFSLCDDNRNCTFVVHKIPFKTTLGRDRSNNAVILNRIIEGEYKLCTSSLYYDIKKKKFFLLACIDMPKQEIKLNKDIECIAELGMETPIKVQCLKRFDKIGNKEEYLYQRVQIQQKLQQLQKSLKYANGGHGRKQKLQAINRFELKEKNYVTTKIHTYSRLLINFAIQQKAQIIVLSNQTQKEAEAKTDEYLLRNWSYFGLKTMIEYKARLMGIEVVER